MSRGEYAMCAIVAFFIAMIVVDPFIREECGARRPLYHDDLVVIGCKPKR